MNPGMIFIGVVLAFILLVGVFVMIQSRRAAVPDTSPGASPAIFLGISTDKLKISESGSGPYILSVLSVPDSVDDFTTQMRQIESSLCDWQTKRKNMCYSVIMAVVCDPQCHSAIESRINKAYNEEAVLSPFLKSVKLNIQYKDANGQTVKQRTFEKVA